MRLGRVIGTVISTRKRPQMEGFKLLMVRDIEADGTEKDDYVVAIDAMGAGIGEVVITVAGSSSREDIRTKKAATDTTVIAIVDRMTDIEGGVLYSKTEDG